MVYRRLGNLFSQFFTRNLEFAQYMDTGYLYPRLTIKKNYYSMRPYNPFAIKVSFHDKNDEFPTEFLVYRANKNPEFWWTALSPRGIFVDPVGVYPCWEDALNALETHCMEFLDNNDLKWDNIVEF